MEQKELKKSVDEKIELWAAKERKYLEKPTLTKGAKGTLYHVLGTVTSDPSQYWADREVETSSENLQIAAIEDLPLMLTLTSLYAGFRSYYDRHRLRYMRRPFSYWSRRFFRGEIETFYERRARLFRDISSKDGRKKWRSLSEKMEPRLIAAVRPFPLEQPKVLSTWEILHNISLILDDLCPIPKPPMR